MSPFGLDRLRRRQGRPEDDRPILAVDIDGVLLLMGFEEPPRWPVAELALIGGALHYLSLEAGERLRRLSKCFQIVWASGWERQSNELSRQLELPDFPFLTFGGAARFGSADWKTGQLQRYAGDRPLAWVDDSLADRCYQWARERSGPTLLIEIDSRKGLQEVHVEALEAWSRSLAVEETSGG
jgi:hypothetical protein